MMAVLCKQAEGEREFVVYLAADYICAAVWIGRALTSPSVSRTVQFRITEYGVPVVGLDEDREEAV